MKNINTVSLSDSLSSGTRGTYFFVAPAHKIRKLKLRSEAITRLWFSQFKISHYWTTLYQCSAGALVYTVSKADQVHTGQK
jgi:hypothetical protein